MPFLEWNKAFEIDHGIIDSEHSRLMGLINELHDAVETDISVGALAKFVQQVIDYTHYHFDHEEKLFLATPYPDAKKHIDEHNAMRERAKEFQEKMGEGDVKERATEFLTLIKNWLIEHIQNTDMKLVKYLGNKDHLASA